MIRIFLTGYMGADVYKRQGYNIPKGLASMERVDKILKAENPIKEPVNPLPLHGMNDRLLVIHYHCPIKQGVM